MRTFIVSALLLTGCATSPEGHMARLPVNQISAVSVQNRVVSLSLVVAVPEAGCWNYHHYDVSSRDFDYNVIVIGQRKTTDPCSQVIGSLETNVQVQVPTSGSYTFHFWTSDSTSTSKTVAVP